MLQRIANYLEKSQLTKQRIKKALYYPLVIISSAGIIAWVLLIFIVPQFETLFRSFNATLPLYTRIVIKLSAILQSYCCSLLITLSAITGLFFYFKKSRKFQVTTDKLLLILPVIGLIAHKAIIAKISRTLATILAAGIPLLKALDDISYIANNSVYIKAITQVIDGITDGQSFHVALAATRLFPELVIQMIAIGEQSGSLEDMLDKIATYYEEELNNSVTTLGTLLEPIIMIILGVIIGSFVLAMYLPIFKLGTIV